MSHPRNEKQLKEHREYMRAWKLANPEAVRQHTKAKWEATKASPERLEQHRKYHREYKRRNYEVNREANKAIRQRGYVKNRVAILAKSKLSIWAIKAEVLGHYGRTCQCCGEAELKLLCLDHISNNGAAERKTGTKTGHVFYAKLKKAGFPSGYQTLCYNCNCAKGFYGECPHIKEGQIALMMLGAC